VPLADGGGNRRRHSRGKRDEQRGRNDDFDKREPTIVMHDDV